MAPVELAVLRVGAPKPPLDSVVFAGLGVLWVGLKEKHVVGLAAAPVPKANIEGADAVAATVLAPGKAA